MDSQASRPRLGHTTDAHSISLGTRRQTHGAGLVLTASAWPPIQHEPISTYNGGLWGGAASLICPAAA